MTAPANEGACRVLVGLLEARTGQALAPNRIWRIETALKPVMRKHEIATLDCLVARLATDGDAGLVDEVIDALLNNESYFFRDHIVFDQLNDRVFKDLRVRNAASRSLSIWTAGCSTGQEAYSIAMMLADAPHKWRGWTIRIVATDISHGAIAKAQSGLYTQFEIQRGLSVTRMVRWFDQQGSDWLIKEELRNKVDFYQHSLLSQAPPAGPFDIVLCRNVLLYFARDVRTEVFSRLHSVLAKNGVMALGAGETILGQTDLFVPSGDYRGLYNRSDSCPLSRLPLAAAK
jgi:chemotaxis protein methyltransferase CheR